MTRTHGTMSSSVRGTVRRDTMRAVHQLAELAARDQARPDRHLFVPRLRGEGSRCQECAGLRRDHASPASLPTGQTRLPYIRTEPVCIDCGGPKSAAKVVRCRTCDLARKARYHSRRQQVTEVLRTLTMDERRAARGWRDDAP